MSCGDAARDLRTISALRAPSPASSSAYAFNCWSGIATATDESRRFVRGKPAVAWSMSSFCHAVMWLERPGAVIKVEVSEDLRAELSGVVDGIRLMG
ncbi:hypothetical protein [Nonomuraea cavernae]|uniref:hypothetical protein n=1 Tax=Nonomuraea cavernae TaxID=2045107 RepID=UPI00340E6B0D